MNGLGVEGDTVTKTYGYDLNGEVAFVSLGDKTSAFTYNELGQVITDINGNINKVYDYDQYCNIEAEYTYDANGNRATLRYNEIELGADYSYNLINRVKEIIIINNINVEPASVLQHHTHMIRTTELKQKPSLRQHKQRLNITLMILMGIRLVLEVK